MMNSKTAFLLLFLLMAFACNDILEEDISNDTITLLTPQDEYSTQETEQLFWWKSLEGATEYQVLIASPDLQNPTTLMLDSTVTKDRLLFTLPVGDYQWCVRGKNSGYSTEYACRIIHIIN